MSDEKRIAHQLEEYLETGGSDQGLLDPATRQVADSLLRAAEGEHPRPDFVNELALQMQEKHRQTNGRPTRPLFSRFLQLASGAVALSVLLAIVFYATGLLRPPAFEPVVEDLETQVDSQLLQPSSGPLAGHQLQITTELPEGPAEIRAYQASPIRLPDTAEGALELGRAFGLRNPELYRAPENAGTWIVRGEDGASLTLQPDTRAFAGLVYSGASSNTTASGDPLPFEQATQVALTFLANADLLPGEYTVQDQPYNGPGSARVVGIVPVVDGLPVKTDRQPSIVSVLPDGSIASAYILPLTLNAGDETIPVKPAREAIDDLMNGSGGSFAYEYESTAPQRQRIFYPEPGDRQIGDAITVDGWLTNLVAVADGRVKSILNTSQGSLYELKGPRIERLVHETRNHAQVTIHGIVTDILENGNVVLEVEDWQLPSAAAAPPDCRVGTFLREGDSAVLQTGDSETFNLGAVIPGLAGNERIEVCAEAFDQDPVAWQAILSPPTAATGGGGGGSAGVVAQAVEVTREIHAESQGGGVSQQVTEQAIGGIEASESPYRLGEEVTVHGIVGGYLQRDGDDLIPKLLLGVDVDGDPHTHRTNFVLYGHLELLQALGEHHRQMVEIEGTIAQTAGEMTFGAAQAIQVRSFRLVDGALGMQSFLGHIERQNLDGQDVAVFRDAESDARFALTQDFGLLDSDTKVFVTGVVHPETAPGGLPLLETYGTRSGSDVDAASSAADILLHDELPIMDDQPASGTANTGLPQTMLVERVTLIYAYNTTQNNDGPNALLPFWLLSGHSEDGLITFELRIPATG